MWVGREGGRGGNILESWILHCSHIKEPSLLVLIQPRDEWQQWKPLFGIRHTRHVTCQEQRRRYVMIIVSSSVTTDLGLRGMITTSFLFPQVLLQYGMIHSSHHVVGYHHCRFDVEIIDLDINVFAARWCVAASLTDV